MKSMFSALVIVALLAAPALAGGGNKNSTGVRVHNQSQGQVAVIFDNTGTSNTQLVGMTQAQFRNQGGFFLNGGESRTINLRAGTHTVRAAYVNAQTNLIESAARIGTRTIVVQSNQTVTLNISGNAGVNAIFP